MTDPAAFRPDLDPELIELTHRYIAAVEGGDLAALEKFYAPDFVNIRYDRLGRAASISRANFMGLLRRWAGEAAAVPGDVPPPPPAERTEILATTRYSDCASVLLLRVKAGEPLTYNFVWQHQAGNWHVLREFTLHDRLPGVP